MTGIAVSVALTGRLVPIDDPTPLGLSPVADWRRTWVLLGRNVLAVTPAWLFPGLVTFAVAIRVLGASSRTSWRELLSRTGSLLAIILLTAAIEFLATGTLQWVAFNERTTTMGWRYLTVGIHLLLAGIALVVSRFTLPFAGRRSSRLIELLAVPALILLVAAKYGPLELDRGRKALSYCTHQALFLDPPAHAIADSGAAFVIGEYWKVYPLVFRVNSILHQRGEKRTVWPLADRAESARSVWEPHDWQEVTIAALAGDPFVGWSREHFELPELVRIESRDGLDFYRVAGAVAAPAP